MCLPHIAVAAAALAFAYTAFVFLSVPLTPSVLSFSLCALSTSDASPHTHAQVTKHNSMMYLATSNLLYGAGICHIRREAEGFLTAEASSGTQLGLSFPTIVGRPDGGALLMYAFSGNGSLPGKLGPAFAGV